MAVSVPESVESGHKLLGDRLINTYLKKHNINKIPDVFHPFGSCAHAQPQLVIDRVCFEKTRPQAHFFASFHSTPWDDAAGILIHREAGGYSARWNGDSFDPAIMHRGLIFAPNQQSWNEFKNWCNEFCTLPTE